MTGKSQFCSNCGATLNAEAAFCTSCGTPIGAPAAGLGAPNQQKFYYIGGGVAAAMVMIVAIYSLWSPAALGAGGADKNGDGRISLEEFRVELNELKKPQPGKWRIKWGAGAPDVDSNANHFTFSGEVYACGEGAWRDVDRFFYEIRNPSTFDELDRELKKFEEDNRSIKIDRFSIDGDDFELYVSGSGSNTERNAKLSGLGDIAIKGIFSEDRIKLEGPITGKFKASGLDGNLTNAKVEMSLKGAYGFEAERIEGCPD
jgi:zinc-ribbon domain